MGIIMLAKDTGVQVAERPHEQLVGAPPDYHQKTLIAQLADAVFTTSRSGFSSSRGSPR